MTTADITIDIVDWVVISMPPIRRNYYEISRYGDIRVIKNKKPIKQEKNAPNKNKKHKCYMRAHLVTDSGNSKWFLVHRLVAAHFVHMPKNIEHLQVNHIDGNSLNNMWYNLEWVTGSENMIHAYRYGLAKTKGETCHLTKFKDSTIHEICALLEKGHKPKEIMLELNLLDIDKYSWKSEEYNRVRGYIKKLRTRTFRKDIVCMYRF